MILNYEELNKVVPIINAVVPDTATILDILSALLGVYLVVLDLGNTFFSITLVIESQINLPLCGRGIMEFSSASSRIPAQFHNMS